MKNSFLSMCLRKWTKIIHLRPDAYWLREDLLVPVQGKHIDTVIDNPELFYLTLGYIKVLYCEHQEPLRFEGKARKVIMADLFRCGWIRIRNKTRVKSYQAWIIEADSIDRNIWIDKFVDWAMELGIMRKDDRLRVNYTDSI